MTVCLDTGVFLQMEDNHFATLKSAGFRPQPLTPDEFIRLHLAAG
jgi:hypothetical protein